MKELTIGEGTQVTLYFSLSLEDGTEIDSNFDKSPATFSVGDGSLMPGFERALFGMKAGESQSFYIPPEEGFGEHNATNIQELSRRDFPSDVELKEGLVLSFADAQDHELPGVVSSFDDEKVMVDFNHPLAGRTIKFKVSIVDVNPAVTH